MGYIENMLECQMETNNNVAAKYFPKSVELYLNSGLCTWGVTFA